MKIEKINDNQIRCTLTSQDLESRKLRLSELAYGTEKAKDLFRDMMEQANYEFGFEAENMPIMIEAIPVSPDSIILIITKVEDPEELDTRFSKFSPGTDVSDEDVKYQGADDILDLFQKLQDAKGKSSKRVKEPDSTLDDDGLSSLIPEDLSFDLDEDKDTPISTEDFIPLTLIRLYEFHELDDIIQVSSILAPYYQDENSLYKNNKDHTYKLVLHQSDCTPENFNKVCNILSEYGLGKNISPAAEAHLIEHGETIISKTALQDLQQLCS